MARIITLILFISLLLVSCATPPNSSSPIGRVIERRSDKETVYYYPPPEKIEQNQRIVKAIPKTFRPSLPKVKVALLLPMSGKFKELGHNMLNSASLALFNIDDKNLTLIPFDTKGTTYGAQEAVKQAILQDVHIVLGPIFSKSTKTVAPIAAEAGINVVSFSNDRNLADSGVFTLGVLPEQQISRLVEFSMLQGIEDFTAVLPGDAYGAAAAKKLRETVEEDIEASVLKTAIYHVNNQGQPLKLKSHVFSAYNAALNTKPTKDYDEELKQYNDLPIKYPRGMLLPIGGSNLNKTIALLERYQFDRDKIQLLGSSQWFNKEYTSMPLLDGAWFAATPKDRRTDFENKFVSAFGYEPAPIASLAYDAVALVATLARISDATDFSSQALVNPRGFIGVDGIFRFSQNGLAERGMAIYRINNGEVEIIEPAPKSFFEVVQHHYVPEPGPDDPTAYPEEPVEPTEPGDEFDQLFQQQLLNQDFESPQVGTSSTNEQQINNNPESPAAPGSVVPSQSPPWVSINPEASVQGAPEPRLPNLQNELNSWSGQQPSQEN